MASKPAAKIALAICGSNGRMGQRLVALGIHDARFTLVGGTERMKGATIPRFLPDGFTRVYFDVADVLPKADVLIDFTTPEATVALAAQAAQKKKALVIGTTGLSARQHLVLRQASRKIPVVFSPNMSVGVNVLFKLLAQASEALARYDIEIVEAHHNLKKDAPSGTAMRLAHVAAEASKRSANDFVYGREGMVGPRTKKEIGVLAVRAGDIIGDHTVYLAGPGERLELTHRAHSRDAFAAGALEAAAWAVRQKPGLYNMFDVLGWRKKT